MPHKCWKWRYCLTTAYVSTLNTPIYLCKSHLPLCLSRQNTGFTANLYISEIRHLNVYYPCIYVSTLIIPYIPCIQPSWINCIKCVMSYIVHYYFLSCIDYKNDSLSDEFLISINLRTFPLQDIYSKWLNYSASAIVTVLSWMWCSVYGFYWLVGYE